MPGTGVSGTQLWAALLKPTHLEETQLLVSTEEPALSTSCI